jgi:hypothetical protein
MSAKVPSKRSRRFVPEVTSGSHRELVLRLALLAAIAAGGAFLDAAPQGGGCSCNWAACRSVGYQGCCGMCVCQGSICDCICC